MNLIDLTQAWLQFPFSSPPPPPTYSPRPIFNQEVKLSLEYHTSCLEKALDCIIVWQESFKTIGSFPGRGAHLIHRRLSSVLRAVLLLRTKGLQDGNAKLNSKYPLDLRLLSLQEAAWTPSSLRGPPTGWWCAGWGYSGPCIHSFLSHPNTPVRQRMWPICMPRNLIFVTVICPQFKKITLCSFPFI